MGGDAGSMFANIAGRGVGALAALQSLGSPGGLANFMLQRQRVLTDPALRETFVGSPFAAGFFQVGGERGSPGQTLVATPGDFMGPTIPTVAGPAELANLPARWLPRLPPLGPEQAMASAAQTGVVEALTSGDPVRVAQAKMALKIPLTPTEQATAAAAGGQLQAAVQDQTGAPTTVSLDIPGGQLTIGSPYAGLGTSGFLNPALAARAAAATGKVAVETDRGWQLLEPETPPGVVQTPAQGEMPLEQLTPQLLPGQAPQATGRRDAAGRPLYQAVTPPKPPDVPLPPLAPLPGQVGGPSSATPPTPAAPAFRPSATRTPTTGGPPPTIATRTNNPGNIKDGPFARAQPGYVGGGPDAQDGGRFAVFESPQAGFVAQARLLRGPAYRRLSVDAGLRKWSGRGYGGEIAADVGIDPRRPMGSLSDAELGTLMLRQGVQEGFQFPEAGGGIPPRPQVAALPAAPVPAAPPVSRPPPRAVEVVPDVVPPEQHVGYPSPAPAEEAAVPGAAPPAPLIPRLEPGPVAPAAPQLPTQATPMVVRRETQKGATGERTLEPAELPPETTTKAVGTLVNYRNYAQRLLAAFPDPAERARFVGWAHRPRREVEQLLSADRRFADFKTLMAPFQLSFFDRAGAALTENELLVLREALPTGQEATPTDFESKLAWFPDLVEEQLAIRQAQQRTPIEAQTPEWFDGLQRDLDTQRGARWQARGLVPSGAPGALPASGDAAGEGATTVTPTTVAPSTPGGGGPPRTGPGPGARPSGILPRVRAAVVAPERSLFSLAPSIGGATALGMAGALTGPLAPVAIPAGAVVGSVLGEAARMGAEQLGSAEPIAEPAGERLTDAAIRGAVGEVIGAPFALAGRAFARPVVRAAEALRPVVRGPAAPWRMTTRGAFSRATTSQVGGETRVLANVLRDPEELARISLTPENRQRLVAAWWQNYAPQGRRALVRAWDDLPPAARENLAGTYRGDLEALIAAARRTTANEWKELLTTSSGGGVLGYLAGLPLVGAVAPVAAQTAGRLPGLFVTPRLGLGTAGPWIRPGAAAGRRAAAQATSAAGLR